MLAEIFMLRLEAAARVVKFEAATPSRFVPITLPAAKASNPSGGLTPELRAGPEIGFPPSGPGGPPELGIACAGNQTD